MKLPDSSELEMMSFVLSSSRMLHRLQVFCLAYILLISTLPFTSCDDVAPASSQTATGSIVNPLPKHVECRRQSSMRTAAVITKSDTETELTGFEADSSCSSPKERYSIATETQATKVTTTSSGSSTAATIGELQELTGAEETVMELSSGGLEGSSSKSSSELSPGPVESTPVQQPSKGTRTRFKSRRMLAPNRVCTNKDISIFQGQDGSSGIPQYIVQIVNTCLSNCAPSDIHVYCGWFASALLVNPNIFTRIAFNDCLVNGGRPLRPDGCTNKDISIMQSRDGSAGIPQYSVQIVNTCISECAPTNVHVYCGWFASSPPPNPNTFTRLAYNDCLVNGGRPLAPGSIVEFQYANSFMYALSFRSANFCR